MRAAAFARKGIVTLEDALYYFPRRYEDRQRLCSPRDLLHLPEGLKVTVLARMQQTRELPLRGRKQSLLELTSMGEEGDLLSCTWFHVYKGLKEKLAPGTWAIFHGDLKKYRGAPQLVHPEIEFLKGKPGSGTSSIPKSLHWGRVVPIYSRSEKLSQKFIREIIHLCLQTGLPLLEELIPEEVRNRHALPGIAESIQAMHFPEEMPISEIHHSGDLSPYLRRLIFEEFFKFQLVLLMDRAGLQPEPAFSMRIRGHLQQALRKNIPYKLTGAQERVIGEIMQDLQKNTAMNRIVQGDVGSGKTFVAFFAACEAIENGHQVAFMAPTEILAEQHFAAAKKAFANTEVELVLLTGSLSRSEKNSALEKIRNGEAKLVVGTHALIQESVNWKHLAMAIVDEQHRFGVKQRAAMKEKAPAGSFPHILTMTATPIPRSLALTVFGELDVSTIDELPPGRQEIVTHVLRGSSRDRLYQLISREAGEKRQSYIVYPMVNDSEKEGMEKLRSVESEFERLQAGPLSHLRLAMVHGQMNAEERNDVMRRFKDHEFDVLISTTVIEVGVDVPNATVMAVENCERFGLSQLHQLRGRVGRGTQKSYCVLVTDTPPPSENLVSSQTQGSLEEGIEEESPWVRLKILEKTRSGFEIAEHDLKLRGPGDFLGTKQSGSPTFRLADLSRDSDLLETARKEAHMLYERDPNLEKNASLGKWFRAVVEDAAVALKSG